MRECVNSENVGQVEELLLMTEQMQDELPQKDKGGYQYAHEREITQGRHDRTHRAKLFGTL